jgi:hypothetical protein
VTLVVGAGRVVVVARVVVVDGPVVAVARVVVVDGRVVLDPLPEVGGAAVDDVGPRGSARPGGVVVPESTSGAPSDPPWATKGGT